MYVITSELLQSAASLGGLSLALVITLCTMAGRIATVRYRTRAGIVEAETAQLVARSEEERLTFIATREQERLDRALDAELDFLMQLTRRMTVEIDGQVTAVPGPQAARAQVEKKAA